MTHAPWPVGTVQGFALEKGHRHDSPQGTRFLFLLLLRTVHYGARELSNAGDLLEGVRGPFHPLPEGRGAFLGVPLAAGDKVSQLKSVGADFVKKCQETITEMVSTTHPVAKATAVFDFGRWTVDDSTKMVRHGNDEVQKIATHFQPVFGALPNAVAQFVSLKTRMCASFKNGTLPPLPASDSTPVEVLQSFHTTWEKVLTWDAQSFGESHTVVSASLSAIDVTAEVERGWSASNRRKGLHPVSTTAPIMDSSLNIMLHGPPLASWEPTRGGYTRADPARWPSG